MDFYIIPFLTGLLAWFITWLFVKLLFWPNNKGIHAVLENLDIALFINKENSNRQFEAILPTIDAQLNYFFTNKLGDKLPMISMFIGDKTIEQLKTVFVEELREIFPNLIEQLFLKSKADFTKNLTKKWSPLLYKGMLKASRKFRILAFLIGFMWGILMVLIIHHV